MLFGLRRRRTPEVRVLSGLGGSGKTAVAGIVAHRLRRRGVDVWWVSGATATGLQAGMRALAYALGAAERDVNRAWSTSGDAPGLVWRLLEARSRRWLLVIDNADDVGALAAEGETVAAARGWLRPVPSRRGAILVTSRDGDPGSWARWCRIRPIGVLDGEDGARVLRDQVGDPAGSWGDAVALAERLGGLPLALRLAGGYLASTNRVPLPGAITTYAAYRDAYGRGGVTAVFRTPDGALTDERARGVIGRTWELSLDLLAGRGLGAARPLLRLLAGLADAPIPYERVLDAAVLVGSEPFAGLDEARLRELLQALSGLSLVDLETRDAPPARRPLTVRLHPLVRDTVRTPDLLGLAVELLGHAASDEIAGRPEDPSGWPLWQLLDPHLAHVFGAAAEAPVEIFLSSASGALRAVRHLNVSGLYPAAERTCRDVAEACARRLGEGHPATLRARAQLAAVLGASGQPDVACAELSALLDPFAAALGDTHPDTLEVRGSLARWTGESGDTASARAQLAELVPLYTERFGEEHIETLRVRANLASAAGDEWAVRDQFADLIPVYERVCGPTHPDTLRARANLVEAGGDRLGAPGIFAQIAFWYEEMYGAEHPETLRAHAARARWLAVAGERSAARRILAELRPRSVKALGETHPDTVAIDAELRHLSTSVGDGASTILVTGVSGAGKTRLIEAWIRGDAAAEPHRSIVPELYRLPLRHLVPFGRRTVVAVVPGALSREKYAILDRTTGHGRRPSGVVHVVSWGHEVPWPNHRAVLGEQSPEELHRYNLAREVHEFRETCERLASAWRSDRAARERFWLLIAITKADLFWSRIDEAIDYYGGGEFGEIITSLAARVGHLSVAVVPVSSGPVPWIGKPPELDGRQCAELLGDLTATVDDLRHGRRPRSRKQPARRYWA